MTDDQGSHRSGKTGKKVGKNSLQGKIREFEKKMKTSGNQPWTGMYLARNATMSIFFDTLIIISTQDSCVSRTLLSVNTVKLVLVNRWWRCGSKGLLEAVRFRYQGKRYLSSGKYRGRIREFCFPFPEGTLDDRK